MVLAQRDKYRSVEKNRKTRDKSTQLWTKKAKIYNRETIISLTSGARKTGQPPVKEPYTKINSKWTNNLNVRPDTTKLLEENIGIILFDINHSNIFF